MSKSEKLTGIIGLAVIALVVVVVVGALAGGKNTTKKTASNPTSNKQITGTLPPPPPSAGTITDNSGTQAPVKRQVTGKAVTLGAGTFSGGKDVADGLYDVTPGAGQSGNFQVSGTDSYNEILGGGDSSLGDVPKVRVQISDGDQITISGLSSVTFRPVTTPFVKTHTTTNLYAGTFTVGEDIAAGRYTAKPGAGQSGNFQVDGTDSYNEILGGDSAMSEVPSLTVNLTDGDVISISSLSLVTLSPSN